MRTFDVVFDGPPGATSGRFVETEIDGSGVGVGEWNEGRNGLWYLRFTEEDLIELAKRVASGKASSAGDGDGSDGGKEGDAVRVRRPR